MQNNKSTIEILEYFGLRAETRVYTYADKRDDGVIIGAILAYIDENNTLTFAERNYVSKDIEHETQECFEKMQELKSLPLKSTEENRNVFYKMLSSAFVQACYGNHTSAYALVDKARIYYASIHTERVREETLSTACHIVIFSSLFMLTLVGIHSQNNNNCIIYYYEWICGMYAGVLGASFSVWQRYDKDVITGYSELSLYSLEVFARNLIGIISAMILIAIVKEGWITSRLTNQEVTPTNALIIGFIAGFFERLVPSIAEQFAKKTLSDSSKVNNSSECSTSSKKNVENEEERQ